MWECAITVAIGSMFLGLASLYWWMWPNEPTHPGIAVKLQPRKKIKVCPACGEENSDYLDKCFMCSNHL